MIAETKQGYIVLNSTYSVGGDVEEDCGEILKLKIRSGSEQKAVVVAVYKKDFHERKTDG